MTTWQSFSSDAGRASTSWQYEPYRGLLAAKRYQGAAGPAYSYTPAGRLSVRTWVRDNISAVYSYNRAGQVTLVDYSDVTPDVSYIYDHRGFLCTNTWATNILTRSWSDWGGLTSERINGLLVSNRFDPLLRRTNMFTCANESCLSSISFTYDPAGRLQTVTDQTNSATYSYVANSALIGQVLFQRSGSTRMTTTRTYDLLNRLTKVESLDAQASTLNSFSYANNAASQRTSVTNADGSYWIYQYDALGQVTSGRKYWTDGSAVLGQQFDYSFDDIGNRQSAITGGNTSGGQRRYQYYTAELNNQYTQRTLPGYVEILGAADSNATVTVNQQPTTRHGEYFRAEVRAENWMGPVWLGLTNVAVIPSGASDLVSATSGHLLVPSTPERFAYDADGNLIGDGVWTNWWNAENRLIAQETLPAVYAAGAARQRLEYEYDPQGRRLLKRVYEWASGQWNLKYGIRFVLDGWNLVAELDATNNVACRSYAWGLDLSGSEQGAGGVGGLLWQANRDRGAQFPLFDGNGNIVGLVDAATGVTTATYEYGPFGETIRESLNRDIPQAGLRLWLAADSLHLTNGAAVAQWNDNSGRGIVLAQGTANYRPTYSAASVNGHAAVNFDGTDDYLQTSESIDMFGGSNDMTVFVVTVPGATQVQHADILDFDHSGTGYDGFVVQQDGTALNRFYWGYWDGGSWQGITINAPLAAGAPQVLGTVKSGTSLGYYVNGNLAASATVSATIAKGANVLTLGGLTANPLSRNFNGAVAEILVYNRALTDPERTAVETQLSEKYGLSIRTFGHATPFRFSTKYQDRETEMLYYGYRYYNPSTGRWLSRDPLVSSDPIMELTSALIENDFAADDTETSIPYTFVRNSPVGFWDTFGLATQGPCLCGLDVTAGVKKVLQEVQAQFKRLSFRRKCKQCLRLYDLNKFSELEEWSFRNTKAGTAWDIEELMIIGFSENGFGRKPAPFFDGTVPCTRTVTFAGGCYYASAVNYALWGKMNSLCHQSITFHGWAWSQTVTKDLVNLWKLTNYRLDDEGRQALQFTDYGYVGTSPTIALTKCSASLQPSPTLRWSWKPHLVPSGTVGNSSMVNR